MSFNSKTTIRQINESMNNVLLLHSSCQAVIEAEIQEVQSPWYTQLDQELGEAENLVVEWRQSGVLSFQQDVLNAIISCGNTFSSTNGKVVPLFKELEQAFTTDLRDKIVGMLQVLPPPVNGIISMISDYLQKLKGFEMKVEKPHSEMNTTIGQVQAQEAAIQGQINSINSQIQQLNQQVATFRKAIAKAEEQKREARKETIWGIILAPFTGGISLVLVAIGVSSTEAAEQKIDQMQSDISRYQQSIAGFQGNMSEDQRIVATLNGLTMSTGLVGFRPERYCWGAGFIACNLEPTGRRAIRRD